MRLLVATGRSNGRIDGDVDGCVEGELVLITEPCDAPGHDEDCACGSAFTGLGSGGATSTALVVDSALTEADVRLALRGALQDRGRIDPDRTTRDDAEQAVEEALTRIVAVAEHFAVDTVVGRRGERVFPRIGG